MNDILGVLFIALYPYYLYPIIVDMKNLELIKNFNNKDTLIDEKLLKNFYYFLHDYSELESDLYYLFDSFMSRGMKEIYFVPEIENYTKLNISNLDKKLELFHTKWNGDFEKQKSKIQEEYENKLNSKFPIQKRIDKIFKEFLPLVDKELSDYMMDIKIEVSIFLQRWLRCVLIREFKVNELIKLWDSIFAYDLNKIKTKLNYLDKASFAFLDYICTYLIHRQRKFILNSDSNNLYHILLNLENNQSIEDIVKNSLNFRDMVKSFDEQKVRQKSDCIKIRCKNSKVSNNYFQNLDFLEKDDNRKSLQNYNHKTLDIKPHHFRNQSVKSFTNLNMFSIAINDEEVRKIKQKNFNRDIIKLEHIYLKYKEEFSLKDSREFLLLIVKLKNIKLNK
jgi:hypothetical protein